MLRTSLCLAAALLIVGSIHSASAQTSGPAPAKTKLTDQKLKEMKVKWSANKAKLAVCRKEVKSKGLTGDDRWFYISDCMDKG